MVPDPLFLTISLLAVAAWGYLAFFNGGFWHILTDEPRAMSPDTWPSVDIVVPARDEENVIDQSLTSLLSQDYAGSFRVILVDDHSSDKTSERAKETAEGLGKTNQLIVIPAPDLPNGWTGKVAAMQAGIMQGQSDYVLFTDADIRHDPDNLTRLMARSEADHLDLNSLMVRLRCVAAVEKLLIPAFVFFFGMLYPFRRANNPVCKTAAAAGGTMLTRRSSLDNIGGLSRIKSALIDDCSLAHAIKYNGGPQGTKGKTRLSLTNRAFSLRPYPHVADVWNMVARTAFTQLNHSGLALVGTVLGMVVLFIVPVLAALLGSFQVTLSGMLAWIVMAVLYAPMTRFYGLPLIWCFTLPFAACLYLGATVDSAWRTWRGKGGAWKNRIQAS